MNLSVEVGGKVSMAFVLCKYSNADTFPLPSPVIL